MERINRLVIDSSESITDLCVLGARYQTDKSPYATLVTDNTRHPYTAIYDMLFSHIRYDPVVIGESGIYYNMSTHLWRAYFPRATFYGWDINPEAIENAEKYNLERCQYEIMNMGNQRSIFTVLSACNTEFDILVDDSSHLFDHQVLFAKTAYRFLKPGGIMVIEDIKGQYPAADYAERLEEVFPYFSSASFIEAKHVNTNSSDDRLLVLFRNNVAAPPVLVPPVAEPPLLTEARARIKL